jgi:uncharacterized protein YjbI with pentapeptide repeats
VSTRFFTFVTVGAYVAVTVASTTHEMRLRANSLVKLPLLNAEIPIIGPFGFYSIAPWLIVLLHSDLLLQLSILAIEERRLEDEVARLPAERRTSLRQRIANFYYVLYLSHTAPSRFLHLLSAFITWVTAVALPLALLLWIQIRFLPFHSPVDTWFHRAAVLVDASLVVLILLPHLWPRLRRTASAGKLGVAFRRAISVPVLVAVASGVAVFVSLFVATIPDRPGEGSGLFARNMQLRERVLTANDLGPQDINALRDLQKPEELRDVLAKVTPFQALQGRDLRFADLENAVLPRIDLRAVRTSDLPLDPTRQADCQGRRGCQDPPECVLPGLERTQLMGTNFSWASMQGAMLDQAILDDASLQAARLQNGSLREAQVNRAVLRGTKLQQANLDGAKLCGADLGGAELQQASLNRAFLQGASLVQATLPGAFLVEADLRGADLSDADLTNANLTGARLQGAVLHGAKTHGAVFDGAYLDHTDLTAGAGKASSAGGAVNEYLVGLACADPSAAYGLATQALHSPHRDGPGLARALLDAQLRPDCAAIASLSIAMKQDLAQHAAAQ